MKERQRNISHRRNSNLEGLLESLNNILRGPEYIVREEFDRPKYPVIFIVGLPRSGTTLTFQWLVAQGVFGYPSNFISRFYNCPYVGSLIQKMIVDPEYQFKNEFEDIDPSIGFSSNIGKTRGLLSPNGFTYFLRRFIPRKDMSALNEEEEKQIQGSGLLSSLSSVEHVLGKPLVMKGIIFQYNLGKIYDIFEGNVFFIHVNRAPFFNIQSLLETRRKFYGTEEEWYSVKPRESAWLKDLTPVEQVAGQVYFTNASIKKQLSALPNQCSYEISYEHLCSGPEKVFEDFVSVIGHRLPDTMFSYKGPASFSVSNEVRASAKRQDEIIEAWANFSGEQLEM